MKARKQETGEKRTLSPLKQRQEYQRQLNRLEKEITRLEVDWAELEELINQPASHADLAESHRLAERHDELRAAMDSAYREWESVVLALEEIDRDNV